MLRSIAGSSIAIHAEEMRWIDHGREHVTVLGHLHDVLAGMVQVHGALPSHNAKHVERYQHTHGVQVGVGPFQKPGDHVVTMQLGV